MSYFRQFILLNFLLLPVIRQADAEQKIFTQKFGGIELRLIDELSSAEREPVERLELQFPEGTLKTFEHFMIENPLRAVVDLETEKKFAGVKLFPSKSRLSKTVRFGEHQGKFRMVLDLTSKQKLISEAKQNGDTLVLRLGRSLGAVEQQTVRQLPERGPTGHLSGISLRPAIVVPGPELSLILPSPRVQGLVEIPEVSEPRARLKLGPTQHTAKNHGEDLYSLDRETINFLVDAAAEQDLVLENLSDQSFEVTSIVTRASRAEGGVGEDPNEITVTPENFKLAARGYSVVRIKSRRLGPEVEQAYKVNFLVQSADHGESQPKKLSGPSLFIFVKPSLPTSNLQARRQQGEIILSNEGNVSILLDKIQVCSPANECTTLPARRLYSGDRWPIKAMANDTLEFLKKSEDRYEPVKLLP